MKSPFRSVYDCTANGTRRVCVPLSKITVTFGLCTLLSYFPFTTADIHKVQPSNSTCSTVNFIFCIQFHLIISQLDKALYHSMPHYIILQYFFFDVYTFIFEIRSGVSMPLSFPRYSPLHIENHQNRILHRDDPALIYFPIASDWLLKGFAGFFQTSRPYASYLT